MPDIQDWHYDSDSVVVNFADGHKATFEPYLHHSNAEGFKRFTLEQNGNKIFVFEGRLSRYEYTSGIKFQGENVTQQFASTYWRAVRDYFDEKYMEAKNVNLWRAWKYCVSEGTHYLGNLEEGTAQLKT